MTSWGAGLLSRGSRSPLAVRGPRASSPDNSPMTAARCYDNSPVSGCHVTVATPKPPPLPARRENRRVFINAPSLKPQRDVMRAHDITAPYDVTRCYDIMGFYDATVTSLIRIRSPCDPRPTPRCPYGQPDPSCQPPPPRPRDRCPT